MLKKDSTRFFLDLDDIREELENGTDLANYIIGNP
jgi:hypothetical protein